MSAAGNSIGGHCERSNIKILVHPSGAWFESGVLRPRPMGSFLCSCKESYQRKHAPGWRPFPALRAFAAKLAHGTSLCRGRGAESFRAPAGFSAKACDARGRHTGWERQNHSAQFAMLIAPCALLKPYAKIVGEKNSGKN